MKYVTKFIRLYYFKYLVIILLFGGGALSNVSYAMPYIGPIPNIDIKHGYVMARNVVLNPETGEPILVEYNTNGDEANTVSIGGNYRVSELAIVPASDYRFYKKQLEDFKDQYKDTLAKDAKLMSRKEFLEKQYPAADNVTMISPPSLPKNINSVLVRGQVNRIIPNSNELVLLRFSLDMTQTINISDDTISLVASPEGQILAHSNKNIGYRTGFFGKPEDPAELNRPFGSVKEHEGDEVFGPVGLVPITNTFGGTISGKDGRYSLIAIYPLCPPGGFSFGGSLWAELYYRNFLPTGSFVHPYYLNKPDSYYCYAAVIPPTSLGAISAGLAVQGILASSSTFFFQRNFFVDVMFVTGNMEIRNLNKQVVNVTDSVTHTSFTEPAKEIQQNFYDFNGDNQPDKVIRGDFEKKEVDGETVDVFTPKDTGKLQGIFFDGRQDNGEAPDFVRQIDKDNRKNEQVGILKTISEADLRNTDVLFFRESTGELIMERRGLKNTELDPERTDQSPNPEVDLDRRSSEQAAYRIMLRGAADHRGNIGGTVRNRSKSYEEWATDYQLEEPFQQRESDHLRAGEFIKIVAINRATGYMGTARVQLQPADDSGNGTVDVRVPTMTLYPPNLKIWAERNYDIKKGSTKDENRNYTIGAEGAALTSDKTITIYSEWLDEFGKPLPDGLGVGNGEEYGLTARLAKVVSDGVLQGTSAGADLAEFAIAPGRHTQVIKVGNNLKTPEHFYIHVIGKAKKQECINQQVSCPSFTSLGAEVPYDTRPNLLVPFLVPLPDEDKHWQEYGAYRKLLKDFDDPTKTEIKKRPERPLPAYVWQYRPEYQFSQYKLTVKEVNRIYTDAQGTEKEINVLEKKNPLIVSNDDLVNVLYSLISNQYERLTEIDGNFDLLLTLGEEEQQIDFGEDQLIKFDNIEHLSTLDPEDYLTLRLYTNNDASNILWEFAFEYLNFFARLDEDTPVDSNDESVEISADSTEVDLVAHIIGFFNRPEHEKYEVVIDWIKQGPGNLDKTRDSDKKHAVFKNRVVLPTTAGSVTQISAKIRDGVSSTTNTKPLQFRVIPGEPHRIDIEKTTDPIYVGGSGTATISGTAYDKNNNLVADGTPVNVTTTGAVEFAKRAQVTKDGKFSFDVKGTEFDEPVQLTVKIGNIEKTESVTVNPVDISISGIPSVVETGTILNLVVSASAGGTPISGYDIDVWSEGGRLSKSVATTGSDGTSTIQLITPNHPTSIKVKATVALQVPEEVDINVVFPTNRPRISNERGTVVGDITTDEVFNFTRFDGNSFDITKSASAEIIAYGENNEQVTLELGSAHEPNRIVQGAYWMNSVSEAIATDEVGFSNGITENILISDDTLRMAGSSYLFGSNSEASRLKVANAGRISLTNNLSFTVEIKPQQMGGNIVNLGNGVKLNLLSDGRLELEANLAGNRSYSVISNAPLTHEWYLVTGKIENNILSLIVNDQTVQIPIEDRNINYSKIPVQEKGIDGNTSPVNYELVVGDNYNGHLNSLKFYNLNSPQLLLFANGLETQTVTIDASLQTMVPVISTGNMSSFVNQIPMQSVAIKSGDTVQNITLLSSKAFENISSAGINSGLISNTPAFNFDALAYDQTQSGQTASQLLFPQAYAIDISFWDIVSLVGSFIGLDSLQVIWEQLGNIAAGRDVDYLSLSVAILDVLSLFPPAAPLKALTQPAKRAIRLLRLGNPNAIKYLGGVMKRVYQQVKKRDFGLVLQTVAFFLVVADMALDAETRSAIGELGKMINSTDDFIDLIEFASLADPESTTESATAMLFEDNLNLQYAHLNQYLFPQAHAAVPLGAGRALGRSIKEIAPILAKEGKNAPKTLGELGRTLKDPKFKKARKYAFNTSLLRGAMSVAGKLGVQRIRSLFDSKSRIRGITLIAIVAYLETELDDGRLFPSGQKERQHNIDELRKLYITAIPDLIGSGNRGGALAGRAIGASFHLLQLAILHGLSQTSGDKVQGIEVRREVYLFPNKTSLDKALVDKKIPPEAVPFGREVDILTGTRNTGEIWNELKSYKATGGSTSTNFKKLNAWKWGTGKQIDKQENKLSGDSIHKQFILDRIAKKTFAQTGKSDRSGSSNTFDVTLANMHWHFHKFKTGSSRNPSLTNIQKAFKVDVKGFPPGDKLFKQKHISKFTDSTFGLGIIDKFVELSKTKLEEAIKEELAETASSEELFDTL